jgi:hypothetical protein
MEIVGNAILGPVIVGRGHARERLYSLTAARGKVAQRECPAAS